MQNFRALGAPPLRSPKQPPIANFWLRACFSMRVWGKYGLIMLSKNLAEAYSGVLTIDTTGLNGKLGM